MRVPMVMRLSAAALLAACGGSSGPTGPSGPPAITVVNGATLPSGTIGATVVIEGHDFGSRPRAGASCSTTPRPGTWMRRARSTS